MLEGNCRLQRDDERAHGKVNRGFLQQSWRQSFTVMWSTFPTVVDILHSTASGFSEGGRCRRCISSGQTRSGGDHVLPVPRLSDDLSVAFLCKRCRGCRPFEVGRSVAHDDEERRYVYLLLDECRKPRLKGGRGDVHGSWRTQ